MSQLTHPKKLQLVGHVDHDRKFLRTLTDISQMQVCSMLLDGAYDYYRLVFKKTESSDS